MKTTEELHNEIDSLMLSLEGKHKITNEERIIMFGLYNQLFAIKERNTTCADCVRRVYDNLTRYWRENIRPRVIELPIDGNAVSALKSAMEEIKTQDEKKSNRKNKK